MCFLGAGGGRRGFAHEPRVEDQGDFTGLQRKRGEISCSRTSVQLEVLKKKREIHLFTTLLQYCSVESSHSAHICPSIIGEWAWVQTGSLERIIIDFCQRCSKAIIRLSENFTRNLTGYMMISKGKRDKDIVFFSVSMLNRFLFRGLEIKV